MSSNTNSSSREESNENDVIRTTLKTIGVEECDPAVFVALAEYSKSKLYISLCDFDVIRI